MGKQFDKFTLRQNTATTRFVKTAVRSEHVELIYTKLERNAQPHAKTTGNKTILLLGFPNRIILVIGWLVILLSGY